MTKWALASLGALLICLLLVIVGFYVYYEWIWQEWSPARIERITGIRVPKYKKVEYHKGEMSFTRDFEDSFVLQFKSTPSDNIFDEIDNKIAAGDTGWKRDGKRYFFTIFWGNGFPTPKGEREEDDGMFSITITRGEKDGIITYGTW